jgi:hypothetical protein
MEYQWAHTRVSAIFLEYFFFCFFFTVLEKLFLEIEKKKLRSFFIFRNEVLHTSSYSVKTFYYFRLKERLFCALDQSAK